MGQATPAQAALPVAQGFQPVDEQGAHGAQAAGGPYSSSSGSTS